MRKMLCIMLFSICGILMTTETASAQVKFGVKGGLNMSKLDLNNDARSNLRNNVAGFYIGPMIDVGIPVVGLGFDMSLLFAQRGGTETGIYEDNDNVNAKQTGVEVPINLKYTFGFGNTFGIYIAAGPDVFINFNDLADALLEHDGMSRAQMALNLGAGVKLANHLQVGFTYQIPTTHNYRFNNNDGRLKTWQVGLAYMF